MKKKEKQKLKKQWKKSFEELMQNKFILHQKLSGFLAGKEEMEEYKTLRIVCNCLESFHYTTYNNSNNYFDDIEFASVFGDFDIDSLDLNNKFGIGISLGIMYSTLVLSIDSDSSLPIIPDVIMDSLTNFKTELESFISQRES